MTNKIPKSRMSAAGQTAATNAGHGSLAIFHVMHPVIVVYGGMRHLLFYDWRATHMEAKYGPADTN